MSLRPAFSAPLALAGLVALVALVALAACGGAGPGPGGTSAPTAGARFRIALLSDGPSDGPSDGGADGLLHAAQMAAGEVEGLAIDPVELSGPALAGLTDDPDVVGAVTTGGREAIRAAAGALEASGFAVIELSDDLYETGDLGPSVFQSSTPYRWQAYRLMRYFGPGDRDYRVVGLWRRPGIEGDAAQAAMAGAAGLRGIELAVSAEPGEAGLSSLRSAGAQAVVVQGGGRFLSDAMELLGEDGRRYRGKQEIAGGARPQPAAFEQALGRPPGLAAMVASGDYAMSFPAAGAIEPAGEFYEAFESRFDDPPLGPEAKAYEAVGMLAAAAGEGPQSRETTLASLEGVDRKRYGRIAVSLGPNDHLIAHRDVLGLFTAVETGGELRWDYLMRTFTSDLERTNILEEDWAWFFPDADPRGEAPFYHTSRHGITTDSTDPLR